MTVFVFFFYTNSKNILNYITLSKIGIKTFFGKTYAWKLARFHIACIYDWQNFLEWCMKIFSEQGRKHFNSYKDNWTYNVLPTDLKYYPFLENSLNKVELIHIL